MCVKQESAIRTMLSQRSGRDVIPVPCAAERRMAVSKCVRPHTSVPTVCTAVALHCVMKTLSYCNLKGKAGRSALFQKLVVIVMNRNLYGTQQLLAVLM